jgi:hypothetical protein
MELLWEEEMRSCSQCGYQASEDGTSFCAKCGAKLPDEEASPTQPSQGNKQKYLIIAVVALAVIVAVAVGVIIFMAVSGGDGNSNAYAGPVETVMKTITDDVKTAEGDAALEEPFTLKVANIEGGLPADLSEMKDMLDQISIAVNNGEVSGSVSQPATASDGTAISGQNKTLDINGTYQSGVLKATWTYFRPYGDINVNGGGYIDSKDRLTKETSKCSISGTYNKSWNDGQVQNSKFGPITIDFAVAN